MLAHTTQNGYQLLQLELGQLALAGHACKGSKVRAAVDNFVVAVHAFIPKESDYNKLNTVHNNFQQGYGNYARAAVYDLNRRITAGQTFKADDIARLDEERKQIGFEIREGYERADAHAPEILSHSDYHSLGAMHSHPYCNMSLRQAAYYPHTSADELRQRWWS